MAKNLNSSKKTLECFDETSTLVAKFFRDMLVLKCIYVHNPHMYKMTIFKNHSLVEIFLAQISHFLFCDFLKCYELEAETGNTQCKIKQLQSMMKTIQAKRLTRMWESYEKKNQAWCQKTWHDSCKFLKCRWCSNNTVIDTHRRINFVKGYTD